MVIPHASRTCSITSGFSGSPALAASRSFVFHPARSSVTSMRQTVGGAQKVVTPEPVSVSSRLRALKRDWLSTNTVASAFHGAKKQLHACLAQPGDDRLQWMSPGLSPIQYMVERWPTG